jgi:hypothetical protein
VSSDLQVQAELAEDIIGTYVGRVTAALSRANQNDPRKPLDIERLSMAIWLKGELLIAGNDRARLFERGHDSEQLAAVAHLYEARIAALAAQELGDIQPAMDKQSLTEIVGKVVRGQTG